MQEKVIDPRTGRAAGVKIGQAKETVKDPAAEQEAKDRAEYAKVLGRPPGIADQRGYAEWKKKRKAQTPGGATSMGVKPAEKGLSTLAPKEKP